MPGYESNVQKVIRDLIVDIKKTTNPTAISRVGAEMLIGDMINRIHQRGESAKGGAIGSYSTEPIYVSLTAFVRKKGKVGKGHKLNNGSRPAIKTQRTLQPKGKNGDTKFKNGKTHKSRYFDDGYSEYHDEMGNGTKVNLTLTGQLANDLWVVPAGKDFGLGFSPDYGMKIYPGLENHFNVTIWMASEKEKERVMVAVQEYIDKKLK